LSAFGQNAQCLRARLHPQGQQSLAPRNVRFRTPGRHVRCHGTQRSTAGWSSATCCPMTSRGGSLVRPGW